MRLSDETYEYIKQEATNMFINYDIKGIPINSFEVAIKLGITVIPYSALDGEMQEEANQYSEDGFSIETNDYEWIIYYNDNNKNYSRINQTIMHEIGHYILGHITGNLEEETEAGFFAKYALASPALIHNMKQEITIENIMSNFAIGCEASTYALDYYKKWLAYGPKEYSTYEMQILNQLGIDIIYLKRARTEREMVEDQTIGKS